MSADPLKFLQFSSPGSTDLDIAVEMTRLLFQLVWRSHAGILLQDIYKEILRR